MADILDLSELTTLSTGDMMYIVDDPSGTPADKKVELGTIFSKLTLIGGLERSTDPTEPTEGTWVMWMSDGTGKGDDGDVLIASMAGGTAKYSIVFDHSAGTNFTT